MKTISIFLTLILISNYVHAQYWIAGDTVGRKQIFVEQTFEPDFTESGSNYYFADVIFDIDCDGRNDLRFYSQNAYKWPFLHFSMMDDVEVLHDFGHIRTYEVGDTLPYADSLWTPLLDYIYGIGGGGGYGQSSIENKFIAYRKNAIDTAYCFIRFSNQGTNFTIHEIISNCEVNPIDIIITIQEDSEQDMINDSLTLIYPNPASNLIRITGKNISELVFYDNIGRLIFQKAYTEQTNTWRLSKGLNFVKIIYENGEHKIFKLIIQ